MARFCISSTLVCAVLLLLTGCGYKVGFTKHPQLDTIAVAPVINETAIYNAASDMRMRMSEAIMQDGTYKLADLKHADAILYITVQNIAFTESMEAVVDNDLQYRPEEWWVRIHCTYKLIIPGQGKPLMSGSRQAALRFQAGADIESGRLKAVRQVCYDISKKITWAIAEGW